MIDLIPAKCPKCGRQLELDDNKETTRCKYCKKKIVVKEAIENQEEKVVKKMSISKILANLLALIVIVFEWVYIYLDISESLSNISLIKIASALIYIAIGIGVSFLIVFLSKPIEKILNRIFKR